MPTPSGDFTLERLPKTLKGELRAWDAADELLIAEVFEKHRDKLVNTTLIINDTFGALATSMNQHPHHSWSDSFLSHLATLKNIKLNDLDELNYQSIPSSDELTQSYDLVIIKIPKTLGLLEDQLCRLKVHTHKDTIIIASGMSKHIHSSTLKTFEKIIGTTTTSRATKKARLIFAKNDNAQIHQSLYPKTIIDETLKLTLVNYANVFAKDRLDIGSRFLIEQLNRCPTSQHIVDLGCGNGALGIMAKRFQAQAKISFIDESYAAVTSAKENYITEFVTGHEDKKLDADFYVSDCFNQFDGENVDLILCNPPFHQNHSIGDHIAWEMFKQSFEQLQKNGEIWVIGNRHLAYHVKLKTLFGNCKTIGSNKKFVVLVARKD